MEHDVDMMWVDMNAIKLETKLYSLNNPKIQEPTCSVRTRTTRSCMELFRKVEIAQYKKRPQSTATGMLDNEFGITNTIEPIIKCTSTPVTRVSRTRTTT